MTVESLLVFTMARMRDQLKDRRGMAGVIEVARELLRKDGLSEQEISELLDSLPPPHLALGEPRLPDTSQ